MIPIINSVVVQGLDISSPKYRLVIEETTIELHLGETVCDVIYFGPETHITINTTEPIPAFALFFAIQEAKSREELTGKCNGS